MAGFVIPGSDTCLKISGYVTAQFEAGNLSQGYTHWLTAAGESLPSGPEPLPTVPR